MTRAVYWSVLEFTGSVGRVYLGGKEGPGPRQASGPHVANWVQQRRTQTWFGLVLVGPRPGQASGFRPTSFKPGTTKEDPDPV